MKKITILLMVMTMMSAVFSQTRTTTPFRGQDGIIHKESTTEKLITSSYAKNATYRLTEWIASDNYEKKKFSYDDQDRVIAILDSTDGLKVIDSLFYNEQGLIHTFSGYQQIGNNWIKVYYVDYSFDANGNIIQRINYNSFGTSTFEEGGIYTYTFDAQNRPTGRTLYMGGNLCEEAYFFYDSEGRRSMDVSLEGWGIIDSSLKIIYTYDANGRMATKTTYSYDMGWDLYYTEYFEYDNAGNCIDHSQKDASDHYTNRRLYEYSAVGASDVNMPYYFCELYYPEAYNDVNMRVLEHYYTLDDNFVLQHVCDYHYCYNDLPWSVVSYDAVKVELAPNPASDICTLHTEESPIANVAIYDIFGHIVKVQNPNDYRCSINLSELSSAIYMMRITLENGQTTVKKVVKR